MFQTFRATNFRALKDFQLSLTPFQALIGENNGGKTTILHAILSLGRMSTLPVADAWSGPRFDFDRNVCKLDGNAATAIELALDSEQASYRVRVGRIFDQLQVLEDTLKEGELKMRRVFPPKEEQPEVGPALTLPHARRRESTLADALARMAFFRLDPQAMSRPSERKMGRGAEVGIPLEENGQGFPSYLDALLNLHPDEFQRLEEKVRSVFPEVRSIRTPPSSMEPASRELVFLEKGIQGMVNGDLISEGLLLLTGYCALAFSPSNRPSMLLLDEPEMGLHIGRMDVVVDLLRALSRGDYGPPVQVIFSTHSPDIIDLLEPHEVVLVSRDADRAIQAVRLSEVAGLRERLRGYNLGEYWASFGEAALLGAAR